MRSQRRLPALLSALLLTVPCALAGQAAAGAGPIVIELKKARPTDPARLRLEVLADGIVRVTAAPGDAFPTRASLIVPARAWPAVAWTRREVGDDVVVSTKAVTVRVNRKTGRVAFEDGRGRVLLREPAAGAKTLASGAATDGPAWRVQQVFDSPADEAFYGLGQHQNGWMNLKGRAVDLWQYNSVVSVPFLLSTRGYGILWDNTSHTRFGDPREYQPLSAFELQDAKGQAGGLTAEYFADDHFGKPLVTRTESTIEHEYTDRPGTYPDGFDRNKGSIRWTGAIQATQTGKYRLNLYSSEYVKLWVGGKLVVDTWRQNWHPWHDVVDVPMVAGRTYPIKLEWVPNGGFIGLRGLSPEPAPTAGRLALTSDVADAIDYYVIAGANPDSVIAGYRRLTGEAPMMPKWALGLWQSRERYKTQDEVLSTVREFRKRQIPFDNIVQDWFYWPEDAWGSHDFDLARYPNAQAMVDTLHRDLNAHIMISVWAKFYASTANYKALADSGWVYPHKIQQQQKDWVGPGYISTFYDAFNPKARRLYFQQIRDKLVSKGFDAWWMDSTEPDMGDVPSPEERLARMSPIALGASARYENAFPLVHASGMYEGLRATNPDRRVFILTRSAYAGQQRYATAVWSGDVASRWEALRAQIPAGLNFSMAGLPWWTTDIGGFAPEQRYVQPDSANLEEWRELMTRWFQFGTFNPLLRVHGQFPLREMFNVAPAGHPAYEAMLAYDRLRYRLMPYTYSLAGRVTHEGYTLMRGLVMDFPGDVAARDIPDEFMFGPALLVAPVTAYKARARSVYLPAGTGWYDVRTGRHLVGSRTIQAEAPYSDIPLYVREGSIVPFGPAIQYVDEKPADPIRLYVYTGRNGSFTLYEDDGVSYAYEKGAFSRIPLRWDEASRTLTVGARQGEYPGMLKERTFEVVFVTPGKPVPLNLDGKPDRVVRYSGGEVSARQ